MKIFGFELKRAKDKDESDLKALVPENANDAVESISSDGPGAFLSHIYDIGHDADQSDSVNIETYRTIAEYPDCDNAINHIVGESISNEEENSRPIDLNLNDYNKSESIKKSIQSAFDHVCTLLDVNNNISDLFRRWYIDGRMYLQCIPTKNQKDVHDFRFLDPLKIKRKREIHRKKDGKSGVMVVTKTVDFYEYNNTFGLSEKAAGNTQKVRLTEDSVVYAPSGLTSVKGDRILSYLHKAIKPANQLIRLEDALVIYRIARAPERRLFYIDVGNLQKGKAEEYVNSIMNKYKNRTVYDARTGEIRDDREHMSMLEDFWLPRKEGGRGTEVSSLPGGTNLGEIEDVLFFQRKLFRALNVPLNRLEQETSFSFGRSQEVSREEINFQKFVSKLRRNFSVLFYEALKRVLILRNVIKEEDWEELQSCLTIDFRKDNYFSELKTVELTREKISLASEFEMLIGKYYSHTWFRKNILKQSDEDIEQITKEIEAEKDQYKDDDEDDDLGDF